MCRSRALVDLPQGSDWRFFTEALLATTEYQRFFVLMVSDGESSEVSVWLLRW